MSETEVNFAGDRLDNFFQPLINKFKVIAEVRKQTDVYLASKFNFLNIIRPNENRISDLICMLCDPQGTHGQKAIFLSLFLKELNIKDFDNSLDKVHFVREESTPEKRRVDIVIRHPSINCIIGIENKPWASEQTTQLSDYADYLRNQTDNFFLIYLDGYNRIPVSIEDSYKDNLGNKFAIQSYKTFLIPWLRNCANLCQADKVRWFIRDFITWIDNNFYDLEH